MDSFSRCKIGVECYIEADEDRIALQFHNMLKQYRKISVNKL